MNPQPDCISQTSTSCWRCSSNCATPTTPSLSSSTILKSSNAPTGSSILDRRAEKEEVAWYATDRPSESPGNPQATPGVIFPAPCEHESLHVVHLLAVSAIGADSRLDEARQALDDGLPQVAIYKLRQAPAKIRQRRPDHGGDVAGAGAVRGWALRRKRLAARRNQVSASAESRFWLAQTYAALNKPAKALPLYQVWVRSNALPPRLPSEPGRCSAPWVELPRRQRRSRRF